MPVIRRVPEDYVSFASAQAAADSGDIIYINGRFNELWTLTKAVHVVGAGGLSDNVFSSSTAKGTYSDQVHNGVLVFNLSTAEAAKLPFILIENIYIYNPTGGISTEQSVLRFMGVAPPQIIFNRCLIRAWLGYYFNFNSPGFNIYFDRCRFLHQNTGYDWGRYYADLGEGRVVKCLVTGGLRSNDLTKNWVENDVVTTSTTGYGPVPTDGIVLRWEDFDYEAFRIYGTVTDIPDFILPSQFEVRLYPEKTPQGNNIGLYPHEIKPLTLAVDNGSSWDGSWEFNYLLPTRRYGVLINPPDGMQGHWLRWYNPAVE